MCGASNGTRITQMTRIRTDFVSVKIRQIRAIRVLRRGKSAFIGVMPAAMHRHVCPAGHTSRVAPLGRPSTYASALAYVCTQSTGVTVDVDAPSRGATLEARDSGRIIIPS